MFFKKNLTVGLFLITASLLNAQNKIDSGHINNANTYKKLFFDAALYASMDAEGVYFAPTLKASAGYRIKPKISITAFAHYFRAGLNNKNETGAFRLTTTGALGIFHLGKINTQGMYAGIGLCHQFLKDNYTSSTVVINDKRNYFTAAYGLGYLFKSGAGKIKFAVELFATGPYTEKDNMSSYTEILTQLSLGGKVIF
jgi:hypothetical protein